MASIKAYTDLEQSKKLAEILPLETADMFFSGYTYPKERHFPTFSETSIKDNIPCWSLAALLDIIKTYSSRLEITLRVDKNYNIFAVSGDFVFRSFDECSEGYNNIVDACYEMILKLNELKML